MIDPFGAIVFFLYSLRTSKNQMCKDMADEHWLEIDYYLFENSRIILIWNTNLITCFLKLQVLAEGNFLTEYISVTLFLVKFS